MKKIVTKLKNKLNKIIITLSIVLFNLNSKCLAVVVQEAGNGGNIASSQLFQGIYNIAIDLTGTLQWIIPVIGLVFIAYYVFKIMTGDEQDQQRYKKAIIKVFICIIVSLLLVTLINLVAQYFGK